MSEPGTERPEGHGEFKEYIGETIGSATQCAGVLIELVDTYGANEYNGYEQQRQEEAEHGDVGAGRWFNWSDRCVWIDQLEGMQVGSVIELEAEDECHHPRKEWQDHTDEFEPGPKQIQVVFSTVQTSMMLVTACLHIEYLLLFPLTAGRLVLNHRRIRKQTQLGVGTCRELVHHQFAGPGFEVLMSPEAAMIQKEAFPYSDVTIISPHRSMSCVNVSVIGQVMPQTMEAYFMVKPSMIPFIIAAETHNEFCFRMLTDGC